MKTLRTVHPIRSRQEPAGFPLGGSTNASLPPALHAKLLEGCAEWSVPAGRLLLPQGQHADVCYGLATGMLRLHREGAHGRPVVLDLLEPGRWVGCTHVVAGAPLPFGVATVAPSTLLVLRKSTLQALLESHPAEMAAWLLAAAAAQNESLVAHVGVIASGSIEERMDWLLRVLAERFAVPVGGFHRVHVRLTQVQIAGIVGASRQRVNMRLRALQRQGRVRVAGGWLEIAPQLRSSSL